MNPIIPTVFAHSKEEFMQRFKKIFPVSNNIQIDFMDGKFVKDKSVQLNDIPRLLYPNKNFEAHLMVSSPESWIAKLKEKGFKKIIFHIEAMRSETETESFLEILKRENLLTYIAVNPKTPVEKVFPFLSRVKGILLMGHVPGKEHQDFIPQVYDKIKLLRSVNKAIKIQIDGGVNEKTIKKIMDSGANYVNSGSYISGSNNPKETYRKLNILARNFG